MRNKVIYNCVTYPDVKISTGTIVKETSLQIAKLAIDTFEVEVKSKDPTIVNFTQNAPLEYYRGDVLRDVWYVQDITRVSPDHYVISCISALGRLAQRDHLGGIYTGQPVEDVVADICGDIPVYIKSNLLGTKIYNWLPIANARDNLKELLFVLGANLWQDHDGVLRISTLWDGLTSVIDADRVYMDGASVKTDKPVTAVTVLEHQYTPGTERRELFNGTATQGQRIPFDGPMSALEAQGVTILESGANYAVVSAGSGTLTGCPYNHTTLEITRPVSAAPVKNEVRIEDATLVSLVNSSAVAGRLVDYYACRETINVDAVIRQEHPGEVVEIIHPYDRVMVKAAISSAEIELSATLKGSLTALVGFEPAQAEDSQYFDERVVLTGGGDWIPPEGVEEVTAVLIGKGQPGDPGSDGEAGTANSLWITTAEANKGGTWSMQPGVGGAGGQKGMGGQGGKILRITLPVSATTPIHYNTQGQDAIFGDHTSADGGSSESGYYDPITKDTFAARGAPGIDGAPGGKGGAAGLNVAEPGESGGAVGETPGGSGGKEQITDYSNPDYWTSHTRVGGGGGGGAAKGSAGNSAEYGYGAAGADATAPAPATAYGNGGTGGNGGGCGGYYQCTAAKNPNISPNPGIAWTGHGGEAGHGSEGGAGGEPCIILYYRRLKKINSGAFVTAKKNFFVDKSGRLFIV